MKLPIDQRHREPPNRSVFVISSQFAQLYPFYLLLWVLSFFSLFSDHFFLKHGTIFWHNFEKKYVITEFLCHKRGLTVSNFLFPKFFIIYIMEKNKSSVIYQHQTFVLILLGLVQGLLTPCVLQRDKFTICKILEKNQSLVVNRENWMLEISFIIRKIFEFIIKVCSLTAFILISRQTGNKNS